MTWFGNRYGHSLASRGISVRQLKDIKHFPETINYDDPEEFISAFWIASLNNDFSDFDFEKVFEMTKEDVASRLNRYGYLSLEEFINDPDVTLNTGCLVENYFEEYEWFKEKHYDDFWDDNITDEMIKDTYKVLNQDKGERWSGFDPEYDLLYKFYKENLVEFPIRLQDKIILMDKIIDLQHHRGSVWRDKDGRFLDIERMRNKFEEYYGMIR